MADDTESGQPSSGPAGWWSSDKQPRRASRPPRNPPAPGSQRGGSQKRYEFAEPTVPVERRWDHQDSLYRTPDPAEERTVPVRRRPVYKEAEPTGEFRRSVLFTIAGTILPGLGLIAAKRRIIGGTILTLFAAVLVTGGAWALIDLNGLLSVAVKPSVLVPLSILLALGAVAWVAIVVGTHLTLRPKRHTQPQRVLGSLLVGVLAFAVAGPMAVAARYSFDQAGLVSTVFQESDKSKSATRPTMGPQEQADPWKDKPRVNILLLGGDDGKGRTGTRTDTIMVASVDTKTGDTTLFSLPRNTGRMPFPDDSPLSDYYPNGFTAGNGDDAEFFLNAMYDNVPATVGKDVLGETDNVGADVMKLSVGEALGLKIDYYMLINLSGFRQLIDALGGITVNINTYVAIGGSTDAGRPPEDALKPGADQHLNGTNALWFARGRYGADDFDRMDRQRCVIDAIIEQANPANVLTRYEAIAKAGKEIVKTDLPQEVLPAMVDLSMRVKDGNVRSVVFKHGKAGFSSPNPDFEQMRERVQVAIGEAKKPPKKKKKEKSETNEKELPGAEETAEAESEDVADSCAYNKEEADEALANPPFWAQ